MMNARVNFDFNFNFDIDFDFDVDAYRLLVTQYHAISCHAVLGYAVCYLHLAHSSKPLHA